jgi:hypothetical protein
MNPNPFYPVQTTTGETYVVDGRSKRIVRTIASSFDTTERWRIAKADAAERNRAYVRRTVASRRRIAALVLFAILAGLSWLAVKVIFPAA